MIKALAHLRAVDIGLSPNNLLSVELLLRGPQYEDPRRQAEFFQQLLARIETLPSVEDATYFSRHTYERLGGLELRNFR
jgi:hypothetical protein